MSIQPVTDNNTTVPSPTTTEAMNILPKLVDETPADPVPALVDPMMNLQQVPMETDMIMNATACLEPKIAFHQGEVVVIECPSPDAFYLGIARDDIMELDEETRAKLIQQEQEAAMASAGEEVARIPPQMTVPIKWLERVASFENGDDLYRVGQDDRVQRTKVLCLAHVTDTDDDLLMSGPQKLFIVTMAERHRLIRFIANGGESIMEESEDGDVVDGARVSALVSRATVNNTAFFLVKWAGFENAAMTWEPMNLLTQCCPDLVAHFDDAPYKLAIQFPNQQPPNLPSHPLAQDGNPMGGVPDSSRPGRGRQGGRGRGRGGKVKNERVPGVVSGGIIPSDSSSPAPPQVIPGPPITVVPAVITPAAVPVSVPVSAPVPIAITTEPQPPFFGTPATLTDTSKGPISLDQLSLAIQQQQSQNP